MPFVPIAVLAALVVKFTDLSKRVTSGDYKGAATILFAWAAGIAALFLGGATVWAKGKGLDIGDIQLADLNAASKVFAGSAIGSAGSLAFDFKKARDNTDTALEPTFFDKA